MCPIFMISCALESNKHSGKGDFVAFNTLCVWLQCDAITS